MSLDGGKHKQRIETEKELEALGYFTHEVSNKSSQEVTHSGNECQNLEITLEDNFWLVVIKTVDSSL